MFRDYSEKMIGGVSFNCKLCEPVDLKVKIEGGVVAYNDALAVRHSYEQQCIDYDCESKAAGIFYLIELVSVCVFSVEYLARLFTSPAEQSVAEKSIAAKYNWGYYEFESHRSFWRFFYFFFDIMNMIDLVAILPFWLEFFNSISFSLTFIRLLRLMRLMRLMRVRRLSGLFAELTQGIITFIQAFQKSTLAMTVLFLYTFMLMIIFASVVFTCEQGTWSPKDGKYYYNSYQFEEDAESRFNSIPATFWWVLTTFTTVGYGDLSPKTEPGRFVAVVAMYAGLMLLAMPITIVGGNYSELYHLQVNRREIEAEQQRQAADKLVSNILFLHNYNLIQCFQRWFHFVQEQKKLEALTVTRSKLVVREELSRFFEGGPPKASGRNVPVSHSVEDEVTPVVRAELIKLKKELKRQMKSVETILGDRVRAELASIRKDMIEQMHAAMADSADTSADRTEAEAQD